MPKLLYLIVLLLSLQAHASSTARDEILKIVPSELANLSKEDFKTVSTRFQDKISGKKSNSLFLNYNNANDVTIGFKKDKFKYLLMEASSEMKEKTPGLFGRIYTSLDQKEKNKITKEMSTPSHNAGDIIVINLASESLRLEFSNNENKTLKRIIMWPMGEQSP